MASRRSKPARIACWRKSGVVSMTTFWPSRDKRMEGRRRLSRGSVELQTRHGQPSVGTPIDVPEPRTVIFNGVRGILNEPEKSRTWRSPGASRACSARLGFGLRCRLRRHRLVDLHVSELELAEQVQQQIVFFGCQIAFGLFVQGVEHVDQLARCF